MDFPSSSAGKKKKPPSMQVDPGSIPGLERSLEKG